MLLALFRSFQMDSTHIEGRILGADDTADTCDDFVAFRITLLNPDDPSTAQLQVDQFLPIDHGSDRQLLRYTIATVVEWRTIT